jgi:hypothetical protein
MTVSLNIDRFPALTPLELEARTKKANAAIEAYKNRLAAMTDEELEAARVAEANLNESLLEARGLEGWE